MTDIVERLRNGAEGLWSDNLIHVPTSMREAADYIEKLRQAIEDALPWRIYEDGCDCPDCEALRKARALLANGS